MTSNKNICVIMAHPDDEVLAFGGTIARFVKEGSKVFILFVSTGVNSRIRDSDNLEKLTRIQTQAKSAAKILGANEPFFGNFPDNKLDSVAFLDIVQYIENFIEKNNPNTILTHYGYDLNIDHQIVAKAVITATRPLPNLPKIKIYSGEILSSSEYTIEKRFQPNTYVNIEDFLGLKLAAMECYKDEIREWPHPRSLKGIKSLAFLRGSEAGMETAEALYLLRDIIY